MASAKPGFLRSSVYAFQLVSFPEVVVVDSNRDISEPHGGLFVRTYAFLAMDSPEPDDVVELVKGLSSCEGKVPAPGAVYKGHVSHQTCG
jgi:hypothetical protein